MDEVVYKLVPFNSSYRVGSDGTFWSRKTRGIGDRCSEKWKLVNTRIDVWGYCRVELYDKGKLTRYKLHRLVLLTFVGPCPEGMEACHNDGLKTNNRLSNLRWDTHRNNIQDALDSGHWPKNKTRKVWQIDTKTGNRIYIWFSTTGIDDYFGKKVHQNIIKCCQGEIKTAYGYKWEYAD